MKRLIASLVAVALSAAAFAVAPADFAKKFTVTVNGTFAGSAASNVPVLLRLSEGAPRGFVYADVQNSGKDMLIQDADENELPFEIDTWNPKGESLVWVRFPTFAVDTAITVYYGASGVNNEKGTSAWQDYVGVWHLNETNATSTANSYGEYKNSTATAGINGNLAAKSIANETGKFGKSFRVNDVTKLKTGNFNYGGVWVPGTDALKLGGTFAISGWFKNAANGFYYDHLFYKRAASGNTGTYIGAFAIEIAASSGTTFKIDARGNSSGKTVQTVKASPFADWVYMTFVYDGGKCHIYANGAFVGDSTITAASDNDAALCFGNNCKLADGSVGDAAWAGWIDEVRLQDATPDATWVAAEYAAMAQSGVLTYGEVESMDEDSFKFGDVSLTWSGSAWEFSASIVQGKGNVKAIATDLATDTEHTLIADTYKPGEGTLAGTVELPGSGAYSYAVVGTTAGGAVSRKTGAVNVCGSPVTVERISDAEELTLKAGVFRVSVASELSGDLVVGYTVGGTGVAGEDYKALSGAVTIPAGASSADIYVKPVFNAAVVEDRTVTVALKNGENYIPQTTDAASLSIVNAEVDPFVQFVSADGSDENDGYVAERPRKTVHSAVAALQPMSEVGHCTVHVADGAYPFSASTTGWLFLTNSISVIGNLASPSSVMFTNISTAANVNNRLVYMDHPAAFLSGVTVAKGRTYQQEYGANVRIGTKGGTVSNCVLTAGYGDNYHCRGANLYMTGDNALATHCVITKGYINAPGGGGKGAAVHIVKGRLEHSLIAENYETTGGSKANIAAGVYIENGSIVNCTIAGNTGYTCGGLYVSGKTVTVKNCVIAGNSATVSGGDCNAVALAKDVPDSTFVNCALDTAAPVNETCIADVAANLLSNVGGGDYTLAAASSAKDAGAALSPCPALDLAGKDRVQGKAIDLGAYESDPYQLALSFSADATEGILPHTITYTASATGVPPETPVTYAWDFDGDGSAELETSETVVSNTYEVGGTFTVSVTATAGGQSIVATKEDYVQLAPRILYVDLASENPVVPYGSWETAATALAPAVAASVDGCEIVVRGGEYMLPATLGVEKNVHVRSETRNPASVVLKGGYFTALLVNAPDAWVDGLTISDASGNAQPGGLKFGVAGGTVSNCVIRNCKCYSWSGFGGAAYFAGPGLLTHSVISNCTATTFCGGATKYVLDVPTGRLENNLVIRNYSCGGFDKSGRNDNCGSLMAIGASAQVLNNTFVGNSITNRGLLHASVGARVANNVFADNRFAKTSEETVDASPDVGFDFGSAAAVEGVPAFTNCATDLSEPINETCVVGTKEAFFKDYAAGKLVPKSGGLLVNRGATPEGWSSLVDLAGKPRVNGKAVDIGCFEGASGGTVIIVR